MFFCWVYFIVSQKYLKLASLNYQASNCYSINLSQPIKIIITSFYYIFVSVLQWKRPLRNATAPSFQFPWSLCINSNDGARLTDTSYAYLRCVNKVLLVICTVLYTSECKHLVVIIEEMYLTSHAIQKL